MDTQAIAWWISAHELAPEDGNPSRLARAYLDGDTCTCCGESAPR